jgi:hypothetical protein
VSHLLFPQATLDATTRVILHDALESLLGRPLTAGERFIPPEGGWVDCPFDGWLMPGWKLDGRVMAVLHSLGLPALALPLIGINEDNPGSSTATWHTPPGVDPRFPNGHRHTEAVETAQRMGWFDAMPYVHTSTAHQEMAAAAAGGVLPRFQPL